MKEAADENPSSPKAPAEDMDLSRALDRAEHRRVERKLLGLPNDVASLDASDPVAEQPAAPARPIGGGATIGGRTQRALPSVRLDAASRPSPEAWPGHADRDAATPAPTTPRPLPSLRGVATRPALTPYYVAGAIGAVVLVAILGWLFTGPAAQHGVASTSASFPKQGPADSVKLSPTPLPQTTTAAPAPAPTAESTPTPTSKPSASARPRSSAPHSSTPVIVPDYE